MGAVPEPRGTLPAGSMAHGDMSHAITHDQILVKTGFACPIFGRCQTNSLGTNPAPSII